MPQVKSVFVWLQEKTEQQLACILISAFIWGLDFASLSLWALNLFKCVLLDVYKQWLWPVVGCFIVPSLKSANIGSDPDCTQQSQIFLWNCYLLDNIVWKLPSFQSNFIASFVKISLHLNFSIFQHILYSYPEKSWNSILEARLWWLFGKMIL